MYGAARGAAQARKVHNAMHDAMLLRSKKAKAPADHSEDSTGTSCYFDTPPTKDVLRPKHEGACGKLIRLAT